MKKSLLIVALGFLIAGFVHAVPKQADKTSANQNDGKHLSKKSPPSATGATEDRPSPGGPSPPKKQDSSNPKPQQAKWFINVLWPFLRDKFLPPLLANWPMVVVAVWGILVALRTLRPTENAAKAAGTSAEAQMSAERAWVLVDRGELADRIQDPYLLTQDRMIVEARLSHCIFFIKNFGKTPGRMTMCEPELQLGPGSDRPPNPKIYEKVPDSNSQVIMLAPGESRAIQALGLTTMTQEDIASATTTNVSFKNRRFLWLCGRIAYEDIFDRPSNQHETNFCFLYEVSFNTSKPFWRVAGPREYSRCT